jgi:hypothetical protein
MPSSNPSPAPNPSTDPTEDRIDVVVPVRTEFAATVRTVAASLGADAGFSIDEIDDFRLGLSEVFAAFVDAPAVRDGRLRVSFVSSNGHLTASATPEHGTTDVEFDELASSILHSVVDEFVTGPDGVRIVKRAVEIAGASGESPDPTPDAGTAAGE